MRNGVDTQTVRILDTRRLAAVASVAHGQPAQPRGDRLHLWRRGRAGRVAPGICYGQLDVDCEDPQPIAARLRPQIPAGTPVISSPLRRARLLALALDSQAGIDGRLSEIDFGEWEGRPWNDIDREALDAWFEAHDLLRHPLEAEGYPSIGCSPCTSKVKPGEDPRAGRWRGWDKTECGLHTPIPDGDPEQPSF